MRSPGLRWGLVVVPALGVAFLDFAREALFPETLRGWPGSLLFLALIVVGAIAMTHGVFWLFERRRRSLLWLAGELSALAAVTTRGALSQREALESILGIAVRSLRAGSGAIYLLDERAGRLPRAAVTGPAAALDALPEHLDPGEAAVAQALDAAGVTVSRRFLPGGRSAGGDRTTALVPLRSRDAVLGLLVLVEGRHTHLRDNSDLLAVLGTEVAVIVDNFRLFDETQQLLERSKWVAVLEERNRLSREMHDSLAQVLGLLGIKARIVQELLSRQAYARAKVEVAEVAETADAAYADVREAILGLRGSTARRELVETLREYLRQFGQQTGLRTSLVVDPAGAAELAPAAETQLVRVIQEALTNVRKHARAASVEVRFDSDGGRARIVVEDDGRGFDAALTRPDGDPGFGLQSMAERVEGLGGTLTIDSRPGAGTRVIVRLPVKPRTRLCHPRPGEVAAAEPAESVPARASQVTTSP